MLYTIGNTKSYTQYFAEDDQPRKLGIQGDYQGGAVFQTKEDAEEYLAKNNRTGYSVYGLATTFDNVHHIEGEIFWRLKESCDLIQL